MNTKLLKNRFRWILVFSGFGVLSVCSVYVGYLFFLAAVLDSTKPKLFGNDHRVMESLKKNENGDSYKFLVLGDSRGNYPVEENLIKPVADEIDFAVIIGDASDNTRSSQKYLRQTMRRLNLNKPFFYVPGNNDFGLKKRGEYLNLFTAADFKREYGPLNFSFTYHNDLFIAICSIGREKFNEKAFEFLQGFINKRGQFRHCFVFMHIPPPLPVIDPNRFNADKEFLNLFEKLKVDYVFASHYHGYQETFFHGVDYVITGGGGADLDTDGLGQFFHAIEFKISRNSISRRFIYSPSDIDFPDWLEVRSTLHVIPFFVDHFTLMYAALFSLALAWGLLILFLIGFRRQFVGRLNKMKPCV